MSADPIDAGQDPVTAVLDKITKHNAEILGCIVTNGARSYSNLPENYELVDAEAVGEYVSNMFNVMGALEDTEPQFENLVLDYDGHTLVAKRIESGVLALVNNPIRSAGLKKMQVGVSLFLKPLNQALNGPGIAPIRVEAPVAERDPAEQTAPAPKRRLFGRLRG